MSKSVRIRFPRARARKTPYLFSGSSLRNSDTNAQDSISAQLALVRTPVELDQKVIDLLLVRDFDPGLDEFGSDDRVDVGYGFGDALADIVRFVAIAQLDGFVDTCRGAGRNCSAESTCVCAIGNGLDVK